ncbi:hypothetical protein B566_EDAN008546 [Ephemera danica]|nr:hypothetical protein B566_EDAN008546 [Ephemera danica]
MKKAGDRSVHTFTGPVAQRRNKKLLTKKKCCVPNCKNTSDTSEDLIFFLVPITLFRKEVFDAIEAGTGERPKQSSGTTYVHVCQAHYKLEEDVKFWNLCNPNTTNGGSYRIQLKAGDTGRASEQTEGNNATFISGFEKRKLPRETAGSEDEGLYDLMETQEAASRNLQQTCERNQQFIPPHTSMNTDSRAGDGDQDTHKNVEESWKEHKCVVCDVAASPRNKLLFPCSRCNFVLDSLIALEIHLAKRHKCGKPVIEVQTYCDALKREAGTHHKCLLCKEELHFGVFEALQSHVNVDHRLCSVCGMRMKSSVEEHIVEHKEQFKSIYQCTGCYFESPFQKKVLDHIRQHHKNGIYFVMESNGRLGFDCPYCHYSTSCNRVLEIHMRHHREKTCIVCDTKYIPSAKHIACDLIKVCRKCQPKSQPTNCDLWDTKSAEPTNCDPELMKPEFVSVDNIKQEPVENFTELESETSGQFSQVQIKQEIKDDEFDLENGERNIDDSPNLNCALNRENSGQFFQVQIKEEENLAGNVTTEHDSELIIGSTTPDDEMDEPNHCPVCEINHGNANQCYLSSVIDDENLEIYNSY